MGEIAGPKTTINGGETTTTSFKMHAENKASASGDLTAFVTALKAQHVTWINTMGTFTGSSAAWADLTGSSADYPTNVAIASGNVTAVTADIADSTIAVTYTDASTTSNAAAVTLGVLSMASALFF